MTESIDPFLWLNAALAILGIIAVGALVVLLALIARGSGAKLAIVGAALLALATVLPIVFNIFWQVVAQGSDLPQVIVPPAILCIGMVCLIAGLIQRSRAAG